MTPAQAGIVALAFVLGGVAAVVAEQLVRDTGTNPSSETVAAAEATIGGLTGEGVEVSAQVVRLPEGYEQRRTPEEPTFTLVEAGAVEVERGGDATTYVAGTSFRSPAGEPYVVRVVEDARLSIVRLTSAG